ncbi:TetR/AcrR family transcriptional regulator [Actinoallomurus sp. CA-150999]|uniref:TetR/AcrR family transcriptional regulator n=1 Tax=Actinoallomurus sp. CA-150999 TaxID=3239887 RepID=UPI003D91B062
MEDTRERILLATLRLIGEHGVGAVTNRRVATAAGVALGSLTYHFPNQTELLRETLSRYVDEEIQRISEIAARLQGITPEQAVVEAERAIADLPRGPEEVATLELHLHASRDPLVREAAVRSMEAYDRLATAILTALDIPGPEAKAPTVVALLYGLAVRRLATGDPSGTAEALRLLLYGATAPQPD